MAMSSHVTLRELLGLGDAPAALRDSALIMIDCQNTCRRGVMPFFHVMHDAGQGSPHDITAEIGQISREVVTAAREPVVVKHYPSSFFQTGLGALLTETGCHDLVIAGFMTHMCVNSTARDAFNLGYRPTIVASATATRDLPGPDGVPVPAAALQAASLAGIADLFALVVGKANDIPG